MSSLFPYLQLIRAPAVFTAISNILAAHLIATGGEVRGAALVLLSAASLCLYAGGMILNDCFDLEEDRRERPGRPLPSGRVPLARAWLLGWGALACGVLLAAAQGGLQLLIALVLAAAIVLYDGVAKRYRVGSLVMGGCRYLNWLLGLSVTGLSAQDFLLASPILLYVVSLTVLSSIETTAKQRAPLVACALGILATGVIVVTLIAAGVLPQRWAMPAVIAGAAFVVYRLAWTYRNFDAENVQSAMKLLIMGVIPLDAMMVFAGAPWWGGFLVLALIVPARILGRWMYVT